MGKSRLAGRLRDIALNETPFKGHFRVIRLDWEKRKTLDLLHLAARDSVSPETVFEHIYVVFRDEGFGRKFDPYEKVVKDRTQAETKVAQILSSRAAEGGDRYAPLRELGGKGLAWLVRTSIPGGTALPEEPTAKAFEAIIGGGAEMLARAREVATTLVRSALNPDELDLFTLPNETLARRLADGIRASASIKPIVLVLDTYEIVDRADTWLREVMKRAGPRVLWIVAGRDNLADSRKFGKDYFSGYRAEFPSDRLRVLPLGEFGVDDVAAYFAECAQERPLDAADVEAIHRATLGIPLAVRQAATLWKAGTALDAIVGEMPSCAPREQIVNVMTERFLMHCFNDHDHPDDRIRLYTLALAHQPSSDLLVALLQSVDLEGDLVDLERRYSFVFVYKMKLHDAVTAFLREYLLQDIHRRSKDVRDIHRARSGAPAEAAASARDRRARARSAHGQRALDGSSVGPRISRLLA